MRNGSGDQIKFYAYAFYNQEEIYIEPRPTMIYEYFLKRKTK